jgi:hypothetical protein
MVNKMTELTTKFVTFEVERLREITDPIQQVDGIATLSCTKPSFWRHAEAHRRTRGILSEVTLP